MAIAGRAPRWPFTVNWDHPLASQLTSFGSMASGTWYDHKLGLLTPQRGGATVTGSPFNTPAAEINDQGFRSSAAYPHVAEVGVICRMRIDDLASAHYFAAHHTTSGSASDWLFYCVTGTGRLAVDIPWVAASVAASTTNLSAAVWRTVAFSRKGTASAWSYGLWADGANVLSSQNTTANPNTSSHNYNVGCLSTSSTSGNLNGRMMDVAIIQGGLSDDEGKRYTADLHQMWDLYYELGRRQFYFAPAAATTPSSIMMLI